MPALGGANQVGHEIVYPFEVRIEIEARGLPVNETPLEHDLAQRLIRCPIFRKPAQPIGYTDSVLSARLDTHYGTHVGHRSKVDEKASSAQHSPAFTKSKNLALMRQASQRPTQ